MASKKQKGKLPTICLDEHANFMRPSFQSMRVIEISKTKLKGMDERNFISTTLYEWNGIFVTCDQEFVAEIAENIHLRHAGIVFIPKGMTKDEKFLFGEIVCGYIRGACTHGKFALQNTIFYPGYNDLRSIYMGKDLLEISWDRFQQELNLE
ncbi:hypothetical protein [Coxiella burnetii]|nr:hypothetical protein [Coxiella burnetii]